MNDFEAHEGSYDHQHRKVHFRSQLQPVILPLVYS